ncbi:alpha/beta fold hydrolase [Chelativorans sp. Marseille-P2723]|uniref:alpha/beta fold hydrolase n=1 Tax=Chelativorans sp. Marseille-P2723 TaxID=2709133 RepID=UPI00156DA851|nr:alpha/beta fold hydrolase [Chelativorans sp. Marseille-P2723]
MTPQTLNYEISGSGPRVVLIHPAGLDLTGWDEVAALLSPRFRILRLDLAGHGASSPARAGMTLADYAGDVYHTLKQADFLPAAIVGLSVGGMVAQELALAYPEAASRLVLAGCPATLPPQARPVLAARGSAALAMGMEAIVDETLQRWFTPAFLESGGAEAVRQRLLADDPAGWNAVWEAISQVDIEPRLHRINVPTLCIAGRHDPASPPAVLQAIAERIPGARLTVLENAPHMMQVECPQDFAAAVDSFLSEMKI